MNGIQFQCSECNRRVYVTDLVEHPTGFRLHGFCQHCRISLKWDLDPLLAAIRGATFVPGSQSIN